MTFTRQQRKQSKAEGKPLCNITVDFREIGGGMLEFSGVCDTDFAEKLIGIIAAEVEKESELSGNTGQLESDSLQLKGGEK